MKDSPLKCDFPEADLERQLEVVQNFERVRPGFEGTVFVSKHRCASTKDVKEGARPGWALEHQATRLPIEPRHEGFRRLTPCERHSQQAGKHTK